MPFTFPFRRSYSAVPIPPFPFRLPHSASRPARHAFALHVALPFATVGGEHAKAQCAMRTRDVDRGGLKVDCGGRDARRATAASQILTAPKPKVVVPMCIVCHQLAFVPGERAPAAVVFVGVELLEDPPAALHLVFAGAATTAQLFGN